MTTRKLIRRELACARNEPHALSLVRSIDDAEDVSGFVVAMGKKWVCLFQLQDGDPNGWVWVRVADIKEVTRRRWERFDRECAKVHGRWPPPAPPAKTKKIDSTRTLLKQLSAAGHLLTITIDRKYPDSSYIGVSVGFGRRTLRLQEVDPDGDWNAQLWSYRLRKITTISVGSVYSDNLQTIAPKPPKPRGSYRRVT